MKITLCGKETKSRGRGTQKVKAFPHKQIWRERQDFRLSLTKHMRRETLKFRLSLTECKERGTLDFSLPPVEGKTLPLRG